MKNFITWKEQRKSVKSIKIINDGSNSDENKLSAIRHMHYALEKESIDDDIIVIAMVKQMKAIVYK